MGIGRGGENFFKNGMLFSAEIDVFLEFACEFVLERSCGAF